MNPDCKIFPDAQLAAEACGHAIVELLKAAASKNGHASIAFSGGSTPKLMFPALASADLDWSGIQVFLVDERPVPPVHADSNYRLLYEHLIQPARIPASNVHRIQAELGPQEAVRRYEQDVRRSFRLAEGELPRFDVIHLGVGSDAHTASLFPGEPLIEDRSQIAAAVYVEKFGMWRMTLLPGVLIGARNVLMLASGGDKAEALRSILKGDYAPREYPAQIVAHHVPAAQWFLDAEAARLLD